MSFLKKAKSSFKNFVKPLCAEDTPDEGHSDSVFLHGHLFLNIFAAKNLPDMESWIAKLYDSKDVTDPFVDVYLGKARIAKTSIVLNDMNPEWNEFYRIEVQ